MPFNESRLQAACEQAGITLCARPANHYQLRGPVLTVNYYPLSKNRTCYVNGAVNGINNCDIKTAITIATGEYSKRVANGKQSRNAIKWGKRIKRKMLAVDPRCYWCKVTLSAPTATLEHIVPLDKGGSNRDDNLALACAHCNQSRGNSLQPPPVSEASS